MLIILYTVQSQTNDLIKQADGVFTKLNSNATAKTISSIGNNLKIILERANSEHTQEITKEIFDNVNEILQLFNSNETRDIIHNLRDLTESSKVYVNINDENWQIEKVMLYVEILLIIIITFLLFLFSLCLYKTFKKRNSDQIPSGIYRSFSSSERANVIIDR